jgi:dTDP-4-dehydrorhamnose reductase
MDITDPRAIARELDAGPPPGVIIHTAALTAVDACERDPEFARAVNADATATLARLAAERGISFIYVSTDYVFDGAKNAPYEPEDVPRPLNVYGATKLAGEDAVRSVCGRYLIARVSWLYSEFGRNFPSTILARAARGERVATVDDQTGSPTYAKDAAAAILALAGRRTTGGGLSYWTEDEGEAPSGTYHVTNLGACTWYDFARDLLDEAGSRGIVIPVHAADLGLPAQRPRFSALSTASLARAGIRIRARADAMHAYVAAVRNTSR